MKNLDLNTQFIASSLALAVVVNSFYLVTILVLHPSHFQ